MKKQLLELGKSLLIILLICSLVVLALMSTPTELIRSTPWLSTALQPLAPFLGLPKAELAYVEEAPTISDAAQPLSISLLNTAGRCTAKWDFAALDAAYETLGGLLGQALDTADSFEEVQSRHLISALSRPSVCFDYGFQLPVQLLASWLDAAPQEAPDTAQMYVLSAEEDTVWLYLNGQQCFRTQTAVSADTLMSLLEQFKPDDSRFAFEENSHLSSLALIPGRNPTISAARSTSPCDNRYIETLATALGFNPYDENRYTDSVGATHFSETNCSLQIAPTGEIQLLSSSTERFHADSGSTEALVELARGLIQQAMDSTSEESRLYLSGVTTQEQQTVCTFEYVLDGIPVSCGEKPAATFTFQNRALTSMELLAATFTTTDEPLKILPPTQAAAIIPVGGDLILQYHRTAGGDLSAGWVK